MFVISVCIEGQAISDTFSDGLGFTDMRLHYYIEIYSHLPKACVCLHGYYHLHIYIFVYSDLIYFFKEEII